MGHGMSDKTIRGVICPGGRHRMHQMLSLIQNKRVDPTLMTTHRMQFSDIGKGFEMVANNSEGCIKPLIMF